jgi:hypothetical protein
LRLIHIALFYRDHSKAFYALFGHATLLGLTDGSLVKNQFCGCDAVVIKSAPEKNYFKGKASSQIQGAQFRRNMLKEFRSNKINQIHMIQDISARYSLKILKDESELIICLFGDN